MNKYVLMVVAALLLTVICFVINPLGLILFTVIGGFVTAFVVANHLLWLAPYVLPLTFLGIASVVLAILAFSLWISQILDQFEKRIAPQ